MTEEEKEDNFQETSFENADNFLNVWNASTSAGSFLTRSDYISVRGTIVDDPEDLNYKHDIDGVSIRWNDVGKGLQLDYTHLNIAPRGNIDIKPIYSLLRKHIDLTEYNANSLGILKKSVGCQLIYYGGWETWLGFIPKPTCRTPSDQQTIRYTVSAKLHTIRLEFQKQLQSLLEQSACLETLAKNNLFDARRVFVLPADRKTILQAFQRAVESTNFEDLTLCPILFSFRFGEKCHSQVHFPIGDESGVQDICVHVGTVISSDFQDLFWCRSGISNLIGMRGQLCSAFSFFECVNFQSNLDERSSDVSGRLKAICRYPESVRFIQLYSDLPHRRPKTRCHPVSASVIMVDGVLRENSQKRVYAEASEYLSEIRNNFNQIICGNCRLEFVVKLPYTPDSVTASELLNKENLYWILNNYAIIAPFSSLDDRNVMACLREVGLHLYTQLLNAFQTERGTGDNIVVWETFQNELAVEKLIWGHPFSFISRIYAVNLGPGLEYATHSLTDQMGFLCLEESSTCCVDEDSSPPLQLYTTNQSVRRQIERLFGLKNHLRASSIVLGRSVMLIVLKDLYDIGTVFVQFEQFLLSLKASAGNQKKRIVGGVTVKQIAAMWIGAKKYKYPMVFRALAKLFRNDKTCLEESMKDGINALKLGYFPAVRTYDESRHEGLNWRYTFGFWVITDIEDQESTLERQAGTVHMLLLSELEKRNLCYTSMLDRNVFPWIKPCLERLSGKKLTTDATVLVMTFITCVALLMNGRFINYLSLSSLERVLPVSQSDLCMLEVLSKFKLGIVTTVNVKRLHSSIPCKLDTKRKENFDEEGQDCARRPQPPVEEEGLTENIDVIPEEESFGVRCNVGIVKSRHMPANICSRKAIWTREEIRIITEIAEKEGTNGSEKYRMYQEECRKLEIADRTRHGFMRKLGRLLGQNKSC
jgi:hypothetical protein